jgi:hypothetical protein
MEKREVIDRKNAGYGKLHNKVRVEAEPYIRLYNFHYIDRFTRKETSFSNYYPATSFCTFGTLLLNAKYRN